MRIDKSSKDYARHRRMVRREKTARLKISRQPIRRGSVSYAEARRRVDNDW